MRPSVPWLLLGSLPALPDLDRVRALPLSEESFGHRLAWLAGSDAAVLAAAEEAVDPDGSATATGDAEAMVRFERYRARAQPGPLKDVVTREWERRCILAAVRAHRSGLSQPGAGWCPAPWGEHLRRHWNDASFGFGVRLPWLADARARLESGEASLLHRTMRRLLWNDLAALRLRAGFSFDSVVAYRLQWRILAERLREDAAAARARLDECTRVAAGTADLSHA